MAKQTGIIKLEGTIGDISFYKSRHGYYAKSKSVIDKNRIDNDPAFQRTRENGTEFGRAGAASRAIRTAFRPLLMSNSDNRVTSRLTQELTRVIRTDMNNARGERNVQEGELGLLTGFEFNANTTLGSTLYVPYTTTFSRPTGNSLIEIPSFIPKNSVVSPQGATHLKFISASALIDFTNGTSTVETANSPEIGIGSQEEEAIMLTSNLPAGSTLPLFIVFGIEFYQEVNGIYYPLKSGSFNALAIVAVDVIGTEPTP